MLNYRFLPGVACLGTLLAVAAAGAADTPGEHPPIPIRFHLESPGMVTLVIEEAHGVRVRNLVSETPFPAGDNIAWWDGLDDLARDGDAATHGVFHIPGKIVAAGDYRVRGLVHAPLDITYEMTPYFPGDPPWITGDRASGWLANHNPPSAVCFVPAGLTPLRKDQKGDAPAQMLIGSHVSEGGSGLAWVGLDGKKLHGQEWLGGVWTGAQYLTRDVGPQRDNEVYAYTAAYWEGDKYNGFRSELRLHALHKIIDRTKAPKDQRFGTGEDWRVLNPTYLVQVKPEAQKKSKLGGIAAHDGILVVSIPANDQLVFFDARQRQVLGAGTLAAPGGVAFDDTGRLFAVSGETVVRFDRLPKFASGAPAATEPSTSTTPAVTLPPATPIITQNLEEPQQLLIDSGRILVSDWGASQQVKIFSAEGKLERTIGEPGGPELGVYHPTRMHRPLGIAVDSSHLLWVAENDYSPKRISIWSLDGKLERALYGPPLYGAGGTLDPADTTRFFTGSMELRLDWKTGESAPVAIHSLGKSDQLKILRGENSSAPERPYHVHGLTYLTDAFNGNATQGSSMAGLWLLKDSIARPVSLIGGVNDLAAFNPTRSFSARWKGQVRPATSEEYTFYALATHGSRLWVDGKPLIQNWRNWGGESTAKITLDAGKRYDICLEMNQNGGQARVQLDWSTATLKRETIPTGQFFPPDAPADAATGTGLSAEYFTDRNLTNFTERRLDPAVKFNWGLTGLTFKNDPGFRARLPQGADLAKKKYFFIWCDLNDDGKVQPEEVVTAEGTLSSVAFQPDLSALGASGLYFKPRGFTVGGAPIFDPADAVALLKSGATQGSPSDGGDQALLDAAGNLVLTTAPKPFASASLGGAKNGEPTWSYPSPWPGLHASHIAPQVDTPGTLIGTTRLLGPLFTPRGSDVGALFAINSNKGMVYLLTAEGLFVSTLFKDCRIASWNAPSAIRGMSVKNLSLNEECFYPSITSTDDGNVYLQGGGRILKVEGLDTLKRLPDVKLTLTTAQLADAQQFSFEEEVKRQAALRNAAALVASIPIVAAEPTVDGKLDDWKDAAWLKIDERTVQVGDWGKRKVVTAASIRVAGDRLFIALKTDRPDLLKNSGEALQNLFKTGGGIDLMIGTDPKADPARKSPVAGDERLLISQINDKTVAMLYHAVVPGTKTPVLFQSPVKSTTIDKIDDVSDSVRVATVTTLDEKGTVKDAAYEVSVPLSILQLKVEPGTKVRADIGILRGNGYQSMQRVYWSNKATGLMSDLAYQAELTPPLWGTWVFESPPKK